jgi:N-acetyl-anhydromuramyl-L-alanine amidase AmpD
MFTVMGALFVALHPFEVPTLSLQSRDGRSPMPNPWKDPGYMKVVWIQSPNFGPRPEDAVVSTIVIHSTVIPTLKATTEAFQRESSQVSAHFTIGQDGSIVQNVSTWDRAWHAGVSRDYSGKENLNHYSIGIELVNLNDGKEPYSDKQLDALRAIIKVMMRRYPISSLTSHEFIAVPSGRKSDPKSFPWEKLKDLGLPMYYGENPLNKKN